MNDIEASKQTSFATNVFKLVGGTALAQGLGVLVAPILSRLYTPGAFGTTEVFVALTKIIGVVACLGYELAIMLPERDEDAANLLAVSLLFAIVISSLVGLLVSLFSKQIAQSLNAPALESLIWLLPVAVFGYGGFLALNYWNSRGKHFLRLSSSRVAQSISMAGTQLTAGLVGSAEAGGLIGGTVFGFVTAASVLAARIWRDDRHLLRESVALKKALSSIRRYYKFPLFGTWTALLNTMSWQLPAMMLSTYFSPTVAGFYAIGNLVVRLPVMLIGEAVAQVFFQRSAEAKAEGQLSQVVESTFQRLVAIGLFPMLLLTLTGHDLLSIVLGSQWGEAGTYTQILSVYMFFNFIAAPLSQIFSLLEKQEAALVINIALFLTRLGALWLGGNRGDIMLTLYLFTTSGALVYGGFSIWLLQSAGVPFGSWIITILRWFVRSAIPLGIGLILCTLLDFGSWGCVLVYAGSALVYFAWLTANDQALREIARRILMQMGGLVSQDD